MDINFATRAEHLQGSAIREMFKMLGKPGIISFAGGNPAPELFPAEAFKEISERMLTQNPAGALQYSVTEGYPRLREQVTEMLKKDNMGKDFDETIIVSGGQHGIELATKVLVNEGDTVICEEPSFIGALNCFRSFGAKLCPVPMESDGMNVELLEKAIKENPNAKMIYTIPSFQNPAGITMSLEKRKEILRLAKKYKIFVLEDNPYDEITFTGTKMPTIKSMDDEGYVIYCGSFSKLLAPGLRVGFTLAEKRITEKMVVCKQVSDVHTNIFCQMLISEYLDNYSIEDHKKLIRGVYKERCEAMLAGMDRCFPKSVTYTRPTGGLFIWCTLNGGENAADVVAACSKKNVVFVPGATFMTDLNKKCSNFRLNFSAMGCEKISEGIEILGNALKEICK